MKCKERLILLIAVVGVYCCGCAAENHEERPGSETNVGNIESERKEETNQDQQESYDEYSGSWTTGGVSYNSVLFDGGTVFSATINGNNLHGSMYSVQGITQQIAEINDIGGTIENGVCLFKFQDDGQGDSGTLYIEFLEDRIEIEVEDFELADSNLTGFAISGIYTLYRAADVDTETDTETVTLETVNEPEHVVSGEVSTDWQQIYYDRYYAVWDSEEAILAEIENRSEYRDNCSFFSDAVYYIEGGGGEYMMKTDISYLVEPLYPMDFVYIEEEDFKNYPPLLLHIFKNEIYARHGYIFRNEDLNNYFRGMIWYTPKYQPTEFDAGVFNEIEVHNLDVLARLDIY